jgi:hypothetical protein
MSTRTSIVLPAIIALTAGLFVTAWSIAAIDGNDVECQVPTPCGPKTYEIPLLPPIMWPLIELVERPEDIDQATKDLGKPAYLLNFHLATPVSIPGIGLDQAVHIPVQITEECYDGGRKSLYFLEPGEEVLSGIYVTSNGIALSYIKRETGLDTPAEDGDVYSVTITNRDGEVAHEGYGYLEILDPTYGVGQLTIYSGPYDECKIGCEYEKQVLSIKVWVLWSCINVEKE